MGTEREVMPEVEAAVDRAVTMADITAKLGAMDDDDFGYYSKVVEKLVTPDDEPEPKPDPDGNPLLRTLFSAASLTEKAMAVCMVEAKGGAFDASSVASLFYNQWRNEMVDAAIALLGSPTPEVIDPDEAAAATLAASFVTI